MKMVSLPYRKSMKRMDHTTSPSSQGRRDRYISTMEMKTTLQSSPHIPTPLRKRASKHWPSTDKAHCLQWLIMMDAMSQYTTPPMGSKCRELREGPVLVRMYILTSTRPAPCSLSVQIVTPSTSSFSANQPGHLLWIRHILVLLNQWRRRHIVRRRRLNCMKGWLRRWRIRLIILRKYSMGTEECSSPLLVCFHMKHHSHLSLLLERKRCVGSSRIIFTVSPTRVTIWSINSTLRAVENLRRRPLKSYQKRSRAL